VEPGRKHAGRRRPFDELTISSGGQNPASRAAWEFSLGLVKGTSQYGGLKDGGFETLKDVLQVVIIPILIFGLATLIPRQLELKKRKNFLSLIQRELEEMEPRPPHKPENGKWDQHLKKRFIHEEIFKNPSANGDFILTLPPDFAYSEAQLWIHYEKARVSTKPEDLVEHGASWCDYMRSVCTFFDEKNNNKEFSQRVYKTWESLVLAYHPRLDNEAPRPTCSCRSKAPR
jgi:hypothetical protein